MPENFLEVKQIFKAYGEGWNNGNLYANRQFKERRIN